VVAGVTVAVPATGRVAVLMLGAMVTEVALVLLQVRTTDWPVVI
jgi:hypothetical protein